LKFAKCILFGLQLIQINLTETERIKMALTVGPGF